MSSNVRLALQYGSNMPVRVALALASTFWLLGLAQIALGDDVHLYRLMRGTHVGIWIAVFAVSSALLWWRIIDRRARPHAGRVINALTCALWLTITTATMCDTGFLAGAGDLTLFLMSAWTTLRTGLTGGDRETA
ncbi:MAG TPA: hypothetical protein PLR28_11210 [Dokdonella sp.]|nr:hypothetical protein [Dokdonella sp.]